MTVVIRGISQRAKNRIREHGNTFTCFAKDIHGAMLLGTGSTINNSKWFGWFLTGDIEIVGMTGGPIGVRG